MSITAADNLMANTSVQLRTLIACSAGTCIANVAWWIQPQLISQLIATGRITESQAGLVASVELAALALSSVVLSRILRRTSLRILGLIGGSIAIAATGLSLAATGYGQLLAARIAVGLGEGAAFVAANIAAARFIDPDRAFGKINYVNIVFGIALVSINPLFKGTIGQTAALPSLLAALTVLTPFFLLMPRTLRIEAPRSISAAAAPAALTSRRVAIGMGLLTASFLLISIMSAALWAFYGLIGTQAGLTDGQIDGAIAVAVTGAFFGGAVAPLIGKIFGRLLPVTLGLLLLTGAMLALVLVHNAYVFRIATCVNVGANYILLPYYLGAAAEADPSGRGTSIIGGAFLVLGAIGPYLGGLLMETVGLRLMSLFVLGTSIAGWMLFVIVNTGMKRDAKSRASSDSL